MKLTKTKKANVFFTSITTSQHAIVNIQEHFLISTEVNSCSIRIISVSFAFLLSIVAFFQILLQSPLCDQAQSPMMGRVVESIAMQGRNAGYILLGSLIKKKRLQIITIFFIWRYTVHKLFQHTIRFIKSCLLRILDKIVH